jgi:phosphoglycolate phosphatase
MIKAIIFDFDGTLTELTLNFKLLRDEIDVIARQYAGEEAMKALDGFYIIEMIYELEGRLGERGSLFQKAAFEKLTLLELDAARGKDVLPYTRDVLRNLGEKGIRRGIVTRTCIEVLRAVFPDMDEYIESVVTRDEVKLVKPHPAQIREALRVLGIGPGEAMLVGDHPTDVMAGNSAGLTTVGVLTGRTMREAFEAVRADHILNDIREILTIEGLLS